jgi:hypothetical protein
MKAIFFNYQTEDESRENIFESEIEVIPQVGVEVKFHLDGGIHYAEVVCICHCFNLNSEFTHIDIELDTF